jgi:hypothetical protein
VNLATTKGISFKRKAGVAENKVKRPSSSIIRFATPNVSGA